MFDCGANSGDLFIQLSRIIDPENYFAFEPSPTDFAVLLRNVGNKPRLFNFALGDENSEKEFFTSVRFGDSSLIEPVNWDEKIKIQSIRLDKFCVENQINRVKLLKVEVEGSEPEVLKGFGSMLKIVEYVAIDGGYERGIEESQTFSTCTNYLLSNGYVMIDVFFPWCRALFQKKGFE